MRSDGEHQVTRLGKGYCGIFRGAPGLMAVILDLKVIEGGMKTVKRAWLQVQGCVGWFENVLGAESE